MQTLLQAKFEATLPSWGAGAFIAVTIGRALGHKTTPHCRTSRRIQARHAGSSPR
jgi:hypothetical protein